MLDLTVTPTLVIRDLYNASTIYLWGRALVYENP
jgi:hypothetical protein